MEEIINKWTSDLEKYKGEFQNQASDIRKWDTLLIENGEKITKLGQETQEAEKAQNRMDTVLQQLESEQESLGTALDYYEVQIKDLFDGSLGTSDGMQPADQEREKTYHTAERLNDTLEHMGTDLETLIDDINKASTTINKTTNPVSYLCYSDLSLTVANI
jgi:nuclear pore complex protein Nup62